MAKKSTTEKKIKEKKILTPAEYGPFDVIKAMFTNHELFEQIPLKILEKYYFIINDRLSMQFPLQAGVFNHYKINGGNVVKCWEWFLQKQGFRQVPSWIYTKGKKKTEEENAGNNVMTKDRIKKFALTKHYDVCDVEFALQINFCQMSAEIEEFERQQKEIERLKKLTLESMKSKTSEEDDEKYTLTLDMENQDDIF